MKLLIISILLISQTTFANSVESKEDLVLFDSMKSTEIKPEGKPTGKVVEPSNYGSMTYEEYHKMRQASLASD